MAGGVPPRGGVPVPGTAVAGAAGLLGLSAVSAAIAGFHALVAVRPGRPAPRVTVVAVEPADAPEHGLRLTLVGPGADEPGWVGVLGRRGRLLAGPPVPVDGEPGRVVREAHPLPGAVPPLLEPGAEVQLSADPWRGCDDPLRLGARSHRVGTDAGPLSVTTAGDGRAPRAVVFVHGRGGSPSSGWWLAPACEDAGWRCVMPAYRNTEDGGPATGRYLLGGEWVDLATVLDDLAGDGVTEVVLAGWSMGGNICASYLRQRHRHPDRFAHHPRPAGLLLDAAAMDWGPVLVHAARSRRLPRGLVPLLMAYGGLRRRVDWRDLNHLLDAAHLDLPVLVFHGTADDVVPLAVSETLGATLGDVRLELVEDAGHCRAVNVDPDRYLGAVADFLARLTATSAASG